MTVADAIYFIPATIGITMFSWLWMRQNKMQARQDDTYSKTETKEMIDLKNQPIKDSLDRNTEVTHELATAIKQLEIVIAQMNKE
jgi:hypothetical protein